MANANTTRKNTTRKNAAAKDAAVVETPAVETPETPEVPEAEVLGPTKAEIEFAEFQANEAKIRNCAAAHVAKAKPQRKMLRVITKINEHPGKALRIRRFHLYREGMTLQDCKLTGGLDHLDVLFYVDHGLMELREATDEEFKAAEDAWLKAKAAKAEPKEEAKAS
ncbi:MAG: hypothetical protein Tp138OMZ00d2C19078261_84 [Prokaryotic dsDNA virus sp.]|jgi:hypothetical protein|nr:MAG: hypothetical protein Tp138OMZ00d2C19078261_84 [Prokaryotic dsDNA virus sp.]|tara:strand:+ start:7562 stop:8059 length:498 start_codon:yes stop_codon:yes gene_type:complete